jgi:hypothetical protein
VLFDPAKVGDLLSLDLQEQEREGIPQPADCTNPYADRSNLIRDYTPRGATWYAPTPQGLENMVRPAFGINGTAIIKDPKFSYHIVETQNCSGEHRLRQATSARLYFSAVSAFACITIDELRRVLPEAKPLIATDGAAPFYYGGRIDDESGAGVRFDFFAGTPCMISIEAVQDQLIPGVRMIDSSATPPSSCRRIPASTAFLVAARKAVDTGVRRHDDVRAAPVGQPFGHLVLKASKLSQVISQTLG